MNLFHIIASCALSSIFIGAVIALFVVATTYVLVMRIKQADGLKPSGYALAVVLIGLLGWHSIKIVGAINLKTKCSEIITLIDNNIEQYADAQNSYSEVPLIATVLRGVEPTAVAVRGEIAEFRESLTDTIWRSTAAAVVVIVISLFVVPYTVMQTTSTVRDRRNVAHKSATRYRRRR
jgi:hypothetical protein